MKDLDKKAFGGVLRLLITLVALLFLPVWTFDYWQAWFFLSVFFASTLAITLYLMKNDPTASFIKHFEDSEARSG